MASENIRTFVGSLAIGTQDPGSYKLLVTGGTTKANDIEVTDVKIGNVTKVFAPTGLIILWSGSIASIPTGWDLCDGTNGTPDLRDRFILGGGNSYTIQSTGGSNTTTLSAGNIPSHTHTAVVAQNGTHAHNAGNESAGTHNHNGSLASGGSHGHNASTNTSGQHSHPGSTGGDGNHYHNTYVESWGNGNWNDMGGGWRNAFTGWFGHKTGWGPNYGSDGSGYHNHNVTVQSNNYHNHNTAWQGGGDHTHNIAVVSGGGHTHTWQVGDSTNHTHNFTTQATGQGQAISRIPPYYALAYIMKN